MTITRINLPASLFGTPFIFWESDIGQDAFGNNLSKIVLSDRFYRVVHVRHPRWNAMNILNIGRGEKVRCYSGNIDGDEFIQCGPFRAYFDDYEFVSLEHELPENHPALQAFTGMRMLLRESHGNPILCLMILFSQVIKYELWLNTAEEQAANISA